ncbi:hypothetical protein Q7P37_008523 [Cladosporium fusiforme]
MKLSTLLNAAFIACCVSAESEDHLFEDLQATNYVGDVHMLRWTMNQSMVRLLQPLKHVACTKLTAPSKEMDLILVEQKAGGWDNPAEILLEDYFMEAGEGTYNWTVPNLNGNYALYIHGGKPGDKEIHYNNQSYWFQIKEHKQPLSKGAIAGIVVGTVGAGVALVSLFVIGIIYLRRKYKTKPHNCEEVHPNREMAHQRLYESPSDASSFNSVANAKAHAELDSVEKDDGSEKELDSRHL